MVGSPGGARPAKEANMDARSDLDAKLAALRLEYARAGLTEAEIGPTPLAQLERWLSEAIAAGAREANAFTLATASPDGAPNGRIVLVKGFDPRGLTFFTNYESAKGRELGANPRACAVFFWPELERQARVVGDVEKVTRAESEVYFHSRPRGSQLGALVSRQSTVIPTREALDAKLAELATSLGDGPVPLPDYWGGYRLVPRSLELWQGRPNRMHDRLRYVQDAGRSWVVERLSP
jgi:pyridoxamine 5'-phosphate oxidase